MLCIRFPLVFRLVGASNQNWHLSEVVVVDNARWYPNHVRPVESHTLAKKVLMFLILDGNLRESCGCTLGGEEYERYMVPSGRLSIAPCSRSMTPFGHK